MMKYKTHPLQMAEELLDFLSVDLAVCRRSASLLSLLMLMSE